MFSYKISAVPVLVVIEKLTLYQEKMGAECLLSGKICIFAFYL